MMTFMLLLMMRAHLVYRVRSLLLLVKLMLILLMLLQLTLLMPTPCTDCCLTFVEHRLKLRLFAMSGCVSSCCLLEIVFLLLLILSVDLLLGGRHLREELVQGRLARVHVVRSLRSLGWLLIYHHRFFFVIYLIDIILVKVNELLVGILNLLRLRVK